MTIAERWNSLTTEERRLWRRAIPLVLMLVTGYFVVFGGTHTIDVVQVKVHGAKDSGESTVYLTHINGKSEVLTGHLDGDNIATFYKVPQGYIVVSVDTQRCFDPQKRVTSMGRSATNFNMSTFWRFQTMFAKVTIDLSECSVYDKIEEYKWPWTTESF